MATDYKAFYSDELRRLRRNSQEFARDNPAIAPMLGSPAVDPDIERLLEGVAFLNAHTRQKLADDFPEMAQELASILMPQVLRPVPAATMILFEPKASLHEKATIAAGTELASRPIESVSCKFVTTMSLEIEPVALRMAQWQTETDGQRFLRLELSSDLPPGSDAPDRLRFFLADEFERATNLLMLLQYYGGHAQAVDLRTNRPFGELEMTFPGFDEPLVPQPENGMPGFGMLRELFVFS